MEEVVREASKRGSDGSLSVIRKCLQVRHTMRLYMGMYIYILSPMLMYDLIYGRLSSYMPIYEASRPQMGLGITTPSSFFLLVMRLEFSNLSLQALDRNS